MVKQGSFFARLKERWSSGSGVKAQAGRRGGEEIKPRVDRVERTGNGERRELVSGQVADPRSTRKMTDREEMAVVVGQHFQELVGLLRGVQSRMEKQGDRLQDAAETLRSLPTIGNRQVELLQQLGAQVERQNQVGENLARTLHGLPDLLGSVEQALQRAAATDERTAGTVREFQATMDRIQGQMGKMVEQSARQAEATRTLADRREESLKGLTKELELGQQRSVDELRKATDEGLASLRRTHEDQSNRLHKVVEEHAGWNRAVLAVLGIVLLGMISILVVLMVK